MYKKYIDIQHQIVNYGDEIDVPIDVSEFPENVVYYIEDENDWWVEKDPFQGQEKDEEIRKIALKLLEPIEKNFDHVQQYLEDYKKFYRGDVEQYLIKRKLNNLQVEMNRLIKELNNIENNSNG
jgi:hypothetical protein